MIKFKFVLATKKACFIFIILFIFVSGCSTTPYLIKDEETLKALKIDDQDGFLVARIYTEFLNINFSNPYHQNQFGLKMLQSVFFSFVAEGGKGFGSDKQELKKLGDWEPLVIIKAPAKKYQWEHLGYRGYFLKANLAKDTFEIEPNSFNYIGDIYVKIAINSKNKYVGHISGKDNFLEVKKQITASFPEASNNYSILNKTSIPRFRESSK